MTSLQRVHHWVFYRYGSVAVPVTALGVTVTGVLFLTTDGGFDIAPYRYVFGTIHRPVWGLVFLGSGLLALVAGSLPTKVLLVSTILLMTAVGTWAFMWLAAALAGVVPPDVPVAWLLVFMTITAAVKRRGIRG